ncbi:DeoR/GlpR transcriptional regulator [Lactobacillus helveticus]|nr:DeoR/GlpR transcriptional regulator [Lactobacillus helveticus]
MSQLHARLAFISPSTLTANGFYMTDVEQTKIKRTMLINSNIVLALIDHTKFNNNEFVKLCDLDYLDYVITDRPIFSNIILQALKKNRVNTIYRNFQSYSCLVISLIIMIRKNDLQIAGAIRKSPLHQFIN